jgi:hypothetical protein
MEYRPYKFLVVAVIQEVDDDGVVVRELQAQEPTAVFGLDGLRKFADEFKIEEPTNQLDGRVIMPSEGRLR